MDGRILVVDDEKLVRSTVSRSLARAGFEVKAVSSGAEAQAALEAGPFDVAIVDLTMPEMTGLQLLSWMGEHAPDVVPVVLSGTSLVEDAAGAVQRGAFDFVSKPIESPQVFHQHIRRAIDHKRLRESNADLLAQLKTKNTELENRLAQLDLAHRVLQSQAMAIQADLNRAMRVQYALLPKTLPFEDRVSMSAAYRPASKVGGDFFDAFPLNDRHLGLFIADSSGHGVTSGMMTVFLKLAVESIVRRDGPGRVVEPGAVLATLNRLLFDKSFGHGIFISMTYVVLDTQTMEARYSSAGHPALLIRRRDGSTEYHRVPAPALGLNPDVCFTDDRFALGTGDWLLLYTDGVLDARNTAGEFYGAQRLQDALQSLDPQTQTVAAALESALLEFRAEAIFGDDIAIVAIGAEPSSRPYAPPVAPSEPLDEHGEDVSGSLVRTAREGGRTFISLSGAGSWRESQRVLDLIDQARDDGIGSIVLDFSNCNHMDSTFLGVLHNLALEFDEEPGGMLSIQGVTKPVLREMSDLGLTSVLMHFRTKRSPLPPAMRTVDTDTAADPGLGRLLIWAHEALVKADPRNADRFASLLEVLNAQVKGAKPNAQSQDADQSSGVNGERP
ncbi:MAG: Response regulator [Candidatus Hydrogenedentes bacterium]|nr:Response regulator [Candidatus Hydrogenedentota bacterium]